MSRAISTFCIGIAVSGLWLVLSSSPAQAGLRIRIGGGPIGVVRAVASHVLALRGSRGHRGGGRVRLANLRDEAPAAMPQQIDISRSTDWVLSPVARVQVAAGTALSGWHGRRGEGGWWQHGDGGYGWVGPLFWPFAYYDIYDYALWGDGMGFWGYGYRDIYAAIFAPYGEDELSRYMAPSRHRRPGRTPSLAQICGDDPGEFSRLPVEQIRQTIRTSEEQRALLDDLANASAAAAQTIRTSCPAEVASTPSARLAAMKARLEAMKSAIARMRTPFETFHESLDDDQKAELAALNNQRAAFAPKVPVAQSCTPPEALPWPGAELASRLHLNEAQRGDLDALGRMSALAQNTLNFDCQPDESVSAPDRLATADTRIDAMLDAINQVAPALDDFYATLSDEQKAQFEAIGPKRAGS
jgi:LTXXQ motif family protein